VKWLVGAGVFSWIISGIEQCRADQNPPKSFLMLLETRASSLLLGEFFKTSAMSQKASAPQAKKNSSKAKQMRKVLGELEPTVRKFVLELLQATYPGYEYSPKHIPGHGKK
jgi:hypothetical protein